MDLPPMTFLPLMPNYKRAHFIAILGLVAACGGSEEPVPVELTGDGLVEGGAPACGGSSDCSPSPLDRLRFHIGRRDFLFLHFQGDGAGSVTLSARGQPDVVCSADCFHRFTPGTQVLMTVVPSEGSNLVAFGGDVGKCIDNQCVVTVGGSKTVSVNITVRDAQWDARRLALIRYLWNQDTIPSWPPDFVEDLGLTLPTVPSYLGYYNATLYALGGQWATPNLDHYERWAMRPLPDIPINYLGQWDWDPIAGTGPLVPVIYFAPTVPSGKLFIIHDGHGPYEQAGHRNLAKWALDHGFGVVTIVMPWTNHDMFSDYDTLYPGFLEHGRILRMFFEATTNAITYAEGLGYTTFVMEGISGGGLDDSLPGRTRQAHRGVLSGGGLLALRAAHPGGDRRRGAAARPERLRHRRL